MQKNDIIEQGTMKNFLTFKKLFYEEGLNSNDKMLYEIYGFDKETIKNCFSIYNSINLRKKRSLNKIVEWSFAIENIKKYKDYKIIFGTLTFSDKTLKKTSKETRRRYIQRFLKENDKIEYYIANIDYGEKNGREHYHFLAFTKEKIKTKWKYGLQKFLEIKTTKIDVKRTTKYLVKLNNHSFKTSTKLERTIQDKTQANNLHKKIKVIFYEEFRSYKEQKFSMLER